MNRIVSKCAAGAWILLALGAGGAAAGTEAQYNDRGLAGITWQEAELAASPPAMRRLILERREIRDGTLRYDFEQLEPGEPREVHWDPEAKTLTAQWDWGALTIAYGAQAGRLNLEVTLENRTDRTIAHFDLQMMGLAFPGQPEGIGAKGKIASSRGKLATVGATWEEAKLLACLETIDPPVHFGFGAAEDGVHPLVLRGQVYAFEEGAVEMSPHGLPRVPAGEAQTFNISLRFAPGETPDHELIGDLHEAFAEFHEPVLEWEDRRPIGAIFLPAGGHKASARNPRGWRMRDFDLTSAASLAEFRRWILGHARRSVEVLKEMDAQGLIVWDVEGGENPHPVTYIGDPRMTRLFSPEFHAVADDYFQIFREAGLRTGVTLRPTQVYYSDSQGTWRHGTGSHMSGRNPLDDDLDQFRPEGLPQKRFFPIVERMSRKIQYAQDRWGCTIFYIDTNGIHVPVAEHGDRPYWILLDAHIYKQLLERHPDVLLIPELRADLAMFAYTAPYEQLDYTERAATPASVRRVYPESFVVNQVSNTDRESLQVWAPRIIEAVRGGDVLMHRGWFMDGVNPWVKAFYAAAERFTPENTPDGADLFEALEEAGAGPVP